MARIRTIKPEFFTSEDIVALSPMARLLYVALWCESDKEGRMLWKPKTFKMRYFPADDCDIEALCSELTGGGLVRLYGDGLAFIPSFTSHQHINPRETASQLPEPDKKLTRQPRVATRHSRDSDAQGGREGKGRECKGDATRDTFGDFWESWPKSERKQDKAKCQAKLKAVLSETPDVIDAILADIAVKKLTDKWQRGFIEAPEVYLNGRRWEDGVTPDGQQAAASEAGFI